MLPILIFFFTFLLLLLLLVLLLLLFRSAFFRSPLFCVSHARRAFFRYDRRIFLGEGTGDQNGLL